MASNVYFGARNVPVDGYQIETLIPAEALMYFSVPDPEPYLVANNDNGQPSYYPLNHSSLFLIFTDLKGTEQDIVEFANKFGFLDEPTTARTDAPETEHPDAPRQLGEKIEFWRKEIRSLKSAVTLWEAIQSNNQTWLGERISWLKDSNKSGTQIQYKTDEGACFVIPLSKDDHSRKE